MSDCMIFPKTVEEFMDDYKVVDAEGIYMSEGTELVPIFRMKQWFEHLPYADATEDMRCEDCIYDCSKVERKKIIAPRQIDAIALTHEVMRIDYESTADRAFVLQAINKQPTVDIQAELDKAYELGFKDGKVDIIIKQLEAMDRAFKREEDMKGAEHG